MPLTRICSHTIYWRSQFHFEYFHFTDKTKLFKDLLEEGRQTAARSVLIAQSNPVPLRLRARKKISYKCGKRYYTLVECNSFQGVLTLLEGARQFQHVKNVPVSSRFLFDTESAAVRSKESKDRICHFHWFAAQKAWYHPSSTKFVPKIGNLQAPMSKNLQLDWLILAKNLKIG